MEGLDFGASVSSSTTTTHHASLDITCPSYGQLITAGALNKGDNQIEQPSGNFTHSYLTIDNSQKLTDFSQKSFESGILGLGSNTPYTVSTEGSIVQGQIHVPINTSQSSRLEPGQSGSSGHGETNNHSVLQQPVTCVIPQIISQPENSSRVTGGGGPFLVDHAGANSIYQTEVPVRAFSGGEGLSSTDCVKINVPVNSGSGHDEFGGESRLEQIAQGNDPPSWGFQAPKSLSGTTTLNNNSQVFFTAPMPTYAEVESKTIEVSQHGGLPDKNTNKTSNNQIIQAAHKRNDVVENGNVDNSNTNIHNFVREAFTDVDLMPKAKDVTSNEVEHICRQNVYKCGGCRKQFETICTLHDHLQGHTGGGSYHYDHVLQTAFPKYDTCCTSMQTVNEDEIKPPSPPAVVGVAKRKRARKPRKVLKSLPEQEETVVKPGEEGMVHVEPFIEYVTDPVKEEPRDVSLTQPEAANVELQKDNTVHDVDDFEPSPIKDDTKYEPEHVEEKKSIKLKLSTKLNKEISGIIKRRGRPKGKTSNKPKIISCTVCYKKFTVIKGLRKHEMVFHSELLVHKCDTCPQKFLLEDQLMRHKHSYHSVKASEEGTIKVIEDGVELDENGVPKRKRRKTRLPTRILGNKVRKVPGRVPQALMTCEFCGVVMKENRLEVHMRMHTGERPFMCDICGKGLISDKKLKRHIWIHTEVKKYKCGDCSAGFLTKYKLKRHMVMHTGEKPYLCAICGAEFSQSQNLAIHTRSVHFGEKRFTCVTCDKKFATSFALKDHMLSHSDERTLSCRFCGKQLKHSKSLRRHEQTHVSSTKFQCDMCSSAFARKDNLDRHKTTHYDTTFQCRFCSKKLKDHVGLIDHEQKNHNSESEAILSTVLNIPHNTTGQTVQKNLLNLEMVQPHPKPPTAEELMEADQKSLMEREMVREMSITQPVFRPDHPVMVHPQNLQKRFHCMFCDEAFVQSTSYYLHMEQRHRFQTKMIPEDPILAPNMVNTGVAQMLVGGVTGQHDQQVFNQINMSVAMAADASSYYKMEHI